MEKIRITIAEYDETPQGYSLMCPPTETEIWNTLLAKMPPDKDYLNHVVFSGWVETEGLYYPGRGYCGPGIPYGILTYYADVYVQDKWNDKVLQHLGTG